jgi:2-dehydro-3-deoxygluconokinase
MADTVSFGEPMVEFNSESVGGLRSGSLFSTGFGGDSSNFAVAASRLGARSSYLTKVGSDVFGALLQQMWHDEGVDASEVIVDDARPTGLYYIMRYGATSEFVYRRSGSAASTLTPDDIPEGWIEKAKVLHVTGITQAISASASDTVFAAIDRARAARVKVAYDPNIRPAIWPLHTARAVARYTISMVDVALPNLEEGRMLTGYEDPRAITEELLALGVPLVVLKMGGAGAIVATPESYVPVESVPVRAVDPTGAGDTFDAAFAVSMVEGRDPVEGARFAAAAASEVVRSLGAVTPIPTRRRADELYAELAGAAAEAG